jgi:GxxExxY protein
VKQGGKEERRLWECSERVIGALIEVHRNLGPGLLESAYESCLCRELVVQGLAFERQRVIPLTYKGAVLDCGYRIDLVVGDCVLVELKTVDVLLPIHAAQVITYLKLSALPVGLLVNFNVPALRNGLRRLWLSSPSSPPPLPVSPLSTDVFDSRDR